MSIIQALASTRSYALMGAVSVLAPRAFLRSYYQQAIPKNEITPHRPYAVTLSFDVDLERDVRSLPEIVTMLSAHKIRAGFAVVGAYVRKFPEEHARLAEAGLEIINHSHTHPNSIELCKDKQFDQLTEAEMRKEVTDAHDAISEVCGIIPKGFRCPHFGELHTDAVYPILLDMGYVYSSSRLSIRAPHGGLPHAVADGKLVEYPVSTCPRHPHSVLDSWHALERGHPWHAKPGGLVRVTKELFAIARETGAYVNVYFDPAAIVALPDRDDFLSLFAEHGPLTGYEEMTAAERFVR